MEGDLLLRGEPEEEKQLEEIINQYSHCLMRTAYLLLGNRQDAEEAVADTFIKHHLNMDNFRGESSIKTYLISILINQCRQKKRSAWYRKVFLFRDDNEELYQLNGNGEDDSKKIVNRLFISQLVQQLSNKEREVVLLFYYHDLSIKEISELLKMREGTVKSHLHRARKLLKELGGDQWDE